MTDYTKLPARNVWSRELEDGDIITDRQNGVLDHTRLKDWGLKTVRVGYKAGGRHRVERIAPHVPAEDQVNLSLSRRELTVMRVALMRRLDLLKNLIEKGEGSPSFKADCERMYEETRELLNKTWEVLRTNEQK